MATNILIIGGGYGTGVTRQMLEDLCLECGDQVTVNTSVDTDLVDLLGYDRVYHNERMVHAHAEACYKPVAVEKEPSWQAMNRGVKSKKQRRQL